MKERPEGDDAIGGAIARPSLVAAQVRNATSIVPRQGARNDHTRRRNLSALLTAVHYGGPLTRAQLTRDTGLNRSTIGGLVAELHGLGLVREDAVAETGTVGRPSLIVRPVSDVAALSLHPDVDALEMALVGIDGHVIAQIREPLASPPSVSTMLDWAVAARPELVARAVDLPELRIAGVGVAVPGLVSADGSTVVHAPHLGWHQEEIGAALAGALGLDAVIGNDANLGLRAEWSYGAARGIDNVVYLNGSASGIGGAALVAGLMLRGGRGYGGEFGHMTMRVDGRPCECGRKGCLEAEVSVTDLAQAAGVGLGDLEGVDLAARERTHPALTPVLDAQATQVGLAIANLECAFDPDLVLLGGFLGSLQAARAALIEEVAQSNAFRPGEEVIAIARTALREHMPHIGAAERAFAPLLSDPAGTVLHSA